MLRLVLLFFFSFFYVKLKREGPSGSRSICPLAVSLRGAMVSSLQWLLLLWGLPGLWAEEHGGKYEEGSIRRRNRQLPPNVIAPNGKCKSQQLCCSSGGVECLKTDIFHKLSNYLQKLMRLNM